jgi:hypothetical protein
LTLTDTELEAQLTPLVTRLSALLAGDVPDPDRFFEHLPPLAAEFSGYREISRFALTRLIHSERAARLAAPYAELLAEIADASVPHIKRLESALDEQFSSLQSTWEADGVALLDNVTLWTDRAIAADDLSVFGVAPVRSGGGAAYPAFNRVCIEIVGETSLPDLPEVVRLVWLVSQLNLDLPMFCEALTPRRAHWVTKLAMLTAVIAGWYNRDAGPLNELQIGTALGAWMGELPEAAAILPALVQWWGVYCERRPAWPVALQALDQYLAKVAPAESLT